MIRVVLPAHLRTLARTGPEITVEVARPVSVAAVLTEVERKFPMLAGTMRDRGTGQRRPFVRFFACGQDLSLLPPDRELPPSIAEGQEPFLIVGAIAGG